MVNANTTYWKRAVAYFDRVLTGEERPEYGDLARRGKRIAERAQALNDRVAELETSIERLKAVITEIHLTRHRKGEIDRE